MTLMTLLWGDWSALPLSTCIVFTHFITILLIFCIAAVQCENTGRISGTMHRSRTRLGWNGQILLAKIFSNHFEPSCSKTHLLQLISPIKMNFKSQWFFLQNRRSICTSTKNDRSLDCLTTSHILPLDCFRFSTLIFCEYPVVFFLKSNTNAHNVYTESHPTQLYISVLCTVNLYYYYWCFC